MNKTIINKLSNKFNLKNYLYLFLLILSGEIIFSLPFHLPRFFRPSFLIEYQISNTQLGNIFAIYGITAMLSYFPGGWLADRIKTNYLIGSSLVLTSLGGLYLYNGVSYIELQILYGFWGITTILLFWGALIKATRLWREKNQGFAFGTLEGGRGLVAAVFASLAFLVFTFFITKNGKHNSFNNVVFFYSLITLFTGILTFLFIKENKGPDLYSLVSVSEFIKIIKSKKIFLISSIIFLSYSCYKGTDIYALYFYDVLGYSEEQSSYYITNMSYIRPFAAMTAGLLADRYSPSKVIFCMFFLLSITYAIMSFINLNVFYANIIFVNIAVSLLAIFSLRAVYFALLSEVNIPKKDTGITVGIVSLVGFTPDIFFSSLIGKVIDSNRNIIGYQNCFLILLFLSIIGICLIYFNQHFKK